MCDPATHSYCGGVHVVTIIVIIIIIEKKYKHNSTKIPRDNERLPSYFSAWIVRGEGRVLLHSGLYLLALLPITGPDNSRSHSSSLTA